MVSPNITPDRETGIGDWTDEQFDMAVRRGKRPDGKRLYPAMPFPVLHARCQSDDVLAIRAYLRTVAPVHNDVESNQLPFPFNIRAGMRVWDALYFSRLVSVPDPRQVGGHGTAALISVEGPGHCGACHTPKTMLGGDKSDRELRGYSIQGWFAPDITNDERRGLGRWSARTSWNI